MIISLNRYTILLKAGETMDVYQLNCCDKQNSYSVHYGVGYANWQQETAQLHYDGDMTLTYFIKCSGNIKIEGNNYRISDGDIVVMNPREIHIREIEKDSFLELISIHIKESILHSFPFEADGLFDSFYRRKGGVGNLIPAQTVVRNGLDCLVRSICEAAKEDSNAGRILTTCKLTELLISLNKVAVPEQNAVLCDWSESGVVHEVLRYISAHFREEINCQQIAERFYLSKFRLEHLFRERVGVSLWEYVILKRLIYFNELIREQTAVSVTEAAWQAGFRNYANFYRLYKKRMNQTPAEYKRFITGQNT